LQSVASTAMIEYMSAPSVVPDTTVVRMSPPRLPLEALVTFACVPPSIVAVAEVHDAEAIIVPWGDVATAYYTTGIPNIEVYIAVPMAIRVGLRLARWAGPFLATGPVQRALKARVARGAPGPSAAARAGASSHLWAEARDDAGRVARARLQTAEAYELTSWTAVELASRALRGGLPVGFQTPAGACGADFILEFARSAREDTT